MAYTWEFVGVCDVEGVQKCQVASHKLAKSSFGIGTVPQLVMFCGVSHQEVLLYHCSLVSSFKMPSVGKSLYSSFNSHNIFGIQSFHGASSFLLSFQTTSREGHRALCCFSRLCI